ncbi:N-acetylmuramoyl-L-alanine amidase [Pseudomonadales bacterium]|nr:N-acetylmuramoyl-L-alanine amidase [Pseudomonadales bacterium]
MNQTAQVGKALLALMLLTGCNTLPLVEVPSENQNSRVNHLVIHFTSEAFDPSLKALTQTSDRPVSAHYLIPRLDDASYPYATLKIFKLVSETARAWHAGESQWFRETALNDRSIGIELVNRSGCASDATLSKQLKLLAALCRFEDYPSDQIAVLIQLIQGIIERHPEISPVNVVGHADIAPDRKVDPGPQFPWQTLHQAGIGAWYFERDKAFYLDWITGNPLGIARAQSALALVGYPIDVTGEQDHQSQRATRAFQMHYRPDNFTGLIDAETVAITLALLNRYKPMLLETLQIPTHDFKTP